MKRTGILTGVGTQVQKGDSQMFIEIDNFAIFIPKDKKITLEVEDK